MPKPLADFILENLKRGGITVTDETKTLLATKVFSEAQLPDELATQFNSAFITVKDAKEHPDVRKEMKGFYLGNAEVKIKQHLRDKYGWTDDQWREFVNADPSRSILERSEVLFDKLYASGKSEGEKVAGNTNFDEQKLKLKAEYDKEYGGKIETNKQTIKTLEEKLEATQKSLNQTKEDATKQVFTVQRDYYLDGLLSSLPVRKDLIEDPELRANTFRTLREKFSNEAELIFEAGKWELRSKSDPTAKYLQENKPIQPEELLKDLAAKFLDPNAGKTQQDQKQVFTGKQNQNGVPPSPFVNSGSAKIKI